MKYPKDCVAPLDVMNVIGACGEGDRPHRRRVCQFTLDGKLVQTFENTKAVFEAVKIKKSTLYGCLVGNVKSAGGFCWVYEDEIIEQ